MKPLPTAHVLWCVLAVCGPAAPAAAQATRTWVSGHGDDANPCTRLAPCKTYAGALGKTAAAGAIDCLDPGAFGPVTITKAISIVCDVSGVVAAGPFGFRVDAPAGAVVTLRGQDIECAGSGTDGIELVGAGVTLHVQDVRIRGCRGDGISLAPAAGTARVTVTGSTITDNGSAVTNAGIVIRPTGGASVNLDVHRVQLDGNSNGIFADGLAGGGATHVVVTESVLTGGSVNGIAVSSAGAAFTAVVTHSTISFNAGTGAAVAGASATLTLGGDTIVNNVTGVSAAGGQLRSFKDNYVVDNQADGTPITVVPSGAAGPLN